LVIVTRKVDCYYPGRGFPAISTTGVECSLSCKHCRRRYLEGMIPATTPEELMRVSETFVEAGASGLLISGGSDKRGKVRLMEFIPSIKAIKSTTDLKVNAHIGLTPRDEIELLVRSGIDAFSVDIFGDDATVRDVTGLEARARDYLEVVKNLDAAGAPIVAPHLCIGIREGKLEGEMRAIESLRHLNPQVLVMISLIPTRGTTYEAVPPPSPRDVLATVTAARENLPETRLLLGCMRSKRDRSWEYEAVMSGLDGIVLPLESTLAELRTSGYSVEKKRTCCALG
jgi:uncharacterized radical SAM superfamily protein